VRKIIYTRDRVAESPAAEDHHEPRSLPQRLGGDQLMAGWPLRALEEISSPIWSRWLNPVDLARRCWRWPRLLHPGGSI
jgi:hypothetical protein